MATTIERKQLSVYAGILSDKAQYYVRKMLQAGYSKDYAVKQAVEAVRAGTVRALKEWDDRLQKTEDTVEDQQRTDSVAS